MDVTGLELIEVYLPVSQVLGFKVCSTPPDFI